MAKDTKFVEITDSQGLSDSHPATNQQAQLQKNQIINNSHLVYFIVFLRLKLIHVKVAKHLKVPQHDFMNYRSDLLLLRAFKSIIIGRQIAYRIYSLQRTLLFYKKANLTKFYNIKNVINEWSEESVVLPLSDKKDFMHYKRSNNYRIEPDFSGRYFRFLDINNELHEVIIYYRDDGDVLSVVNFTSGQVVLSKKVKGWLIASIPIYNNYMPIAAIKDHHIEVYLFDLSNRKMSKIAQYSMSFWGEELYKFWITLGDMDRNELKQLVARGSSSYRLGTSYDICEYFLICKSFIHITNDVLTGHDNGIVFTIALTACKDVINYELFIPEDASFKTFDVDKVIIKHTIDTKQIQVVLTNGNYTMPNILYYDKKYALGYDITNTEKHFIVSRDEAIKYLIDTTRDSMYKMYITGEFIFIVFKTEGKTNRHSHYNILVYDIRRSIWWKEEIVVSTYSDIGIYGCYYIEKCEKVVFLVYNKQGHDNSFFNPDENRRAVNIEQAIVIELSRNLDNINFRHLNLGAIIMKYMKENHGSKCSGFGVKNADCSVDVNNGIMYITGLNYDCDIPVVTLECDLCNNYEVREFGIQYPIVRSRDIASDKAKPIYISAKALKSKNFPKYLPMYLSREFYDFITNKVANSEMVFSSHSKLSVRDRYYNRMDAVLAKIDALRYSVNVALQDDIVMMYKVDYNYLIAVMVMYDLTIVKAR